MKPITKVLKLSKASYYEAHLNIINGLLPTKLTPKEIQVLARFMSFEGDIAKDRFGTTARRMVKKELNLSDGGLSNYMKTLVNKEVIIGDEDHLYLLPALSLSPDLQDYQFRIINSDHVTNRA